MEKPLNNQPKKSIKVAYWVSTGLLALFILPGVFFMDSPEAKQGTEHLDIPQWLAIEIGIGHFIGGLIIVLPFIGKRLKEWAYVGCGIKYISAIIGHLAVDGLVPMSFSPLVVFTLLLISYITYHHLQKK
ncbi:DoxX family protein [Pedobacter xixiisoli]|uniref:DoxX-like family protein n=1 Tax=Pedobacter xixiisoli TaxID=1476464 RepID=A0A285ZPG0_9SPHI|nr:DoxX family protein [Pedobacter xixiisoli]SOD11532.1 DoxX-like family protein [Pedobacter xixiisoli]